MKQINVYFDDDEYKKLIEKKGKLTWHNFIIKLLKGGIRQDEKNKSRN